MPNGLINLEEITSEVLYIYTDNTSFKLNCNSVNEFPDIDLEFTGTPVLMDKRVFKTTINQTIFATSTQESRPILTGINLKIEKDV